MGTMIHPQNISFTNNFFFKRKQSLNPFYGKLFSKENCFGTHFMVNCCFWTHLVINCCFRTHFAVNCLSWTHFSVNCCFWNPTGINDKFLNQTFRKSKICSQFFFFFMKNHFYHRLYPTRIAVKEGLWIQNLRFDCDFRNLTLWTNRNTLREHYEIEWCCVTQILNWQTECICRSYLPDSKKTQMIYGNHIHWNHLDLRVCSLVTRFLPICLRLTPAIGFGLGGTALQKSSLEFLCCLRKNCGFWWRTIFKETLRV